jgi:hypothetical protein
MYEALNRKPCSDFAIFNWQATAGAMYVKVFTINIPVIKLGVMRNSNK